jgi:CRP/FNR family cyclic AMP-dependent transcriptional regulator
LGNAIKASATERRSFAPGEAVFNEGDEGSEMFGVVTGRIELRHGDKVLTSVGPDGTFGEMAIVERSPRSLTAVAVEPTEVAVIDRHRFLFLVHETPTFAIEVMRALAARIHQINELD